MEWWIYPVAILGGFVAGAINTMAGNGSAITLTILMEFMGLPPNVANGSNRVGIFSQSIVSTWVFNKEGKIEWRKDYPLLISIFLGAMLGLYLALRVEDKDFRMIFGIMMIVMLFVVLINPKRWINPPQDKKRPPQWLFIIGFFLMGIYGGFIQMGMGVMFLAFVVLIGHFDLVKANALKIVSVGSYTGVVLLIFHLNGFVDWKAGGLIAVGQVTGAFFTSKFAATHPLANVVAHRVLVAVVVFAIVKIFIIPMF